ncbi:MAG: DUF72 domain-containing protein [Elusimicrobia bacterium]|nr:DUF72 domain-containing protein [Elusimicrobiota bacterium]
MEINSSFYQPPRPATAEKWAKEAPSSFQFSVKAWQVITHPASSSTYRRMTATVPEKKKPHLGHFQDTEEVWEASSATLRTARILKAKFVLFQTPSSFYPNANSTRDMYRFFKKIPRGDFLFVWEPRGSWDVRLVRRVCQDLELLNGMDPLLKVQNQDFKFQTSRSGLYYFRLHGAYENRRIVYRHGYTDEELKRLAQVCEGMRVYVFFNNATMWQDAQRFQKIITL